MTRSPSPTASADAEYDAIEAAVLETARGRWFLAEYARRNRNADTRMLLDAIARLQDVALGAQAVPAGERLRADLRDMAREIARARDEIVALLPRATVAEPSRRARVLDDVVGAAQRATAEILEATEAIQEAAWTLREGGADETLCDVLDRRATAIYAAADVQDAAGRHIRSMVQLLQQIETRLAVMTGLIGAGPATAGTATPAAGAGAFRSRGHDGFLADEDDLFEAESAPRRAPAPAPRRPVLRLVSSTPHPDGPPSVTATGRGEDAGNAQKMAQPSPMDASPVGSKGDAPALRPEVFAAIDAMSLEDKLTRFT
ncbi:hypothetical protein QNA08_09670 [Chelatococcus sp. SYSU_G07232]|uniref:Chemotaxis protein CheZ n=1 Tax=Chelatococcus albus TaxID=3047466 RepID=A0ABT7AGL1_9HYPH|nr:hypothetical protein [Chelatococcus sp. SYSU_G07232]MDJ1158502.1 hypothetical protein [Chelatococcus sp. SYSU_G07232]